METEAYYPPPESKGGWRWPGVPQDAFALMGYRSNYCCIVPSLDLVMARVGTGPPVAEGHSQGLLSSIVAAVIPAES
jgi:hypothetical protein